MSASPSTSTTTLHDTNGCVVPSLPCFTFTHCLNRRRLRPQCIEDDNDINLPYRTLSNDAVINEYTQETALGQILRPTISRATGEIIKYKLVTFEVHDPENPKNWSKPFKWWCTMCIALVCFAVAFASAVVTADITDVARDLHASEEVTLLSITLFVVGFGIGPMAFAYVLFNCNLYLY